MKSNNRKVIPLSAAKKLKVDLHYDAVLDALRLKHKKHLTEKPLSANLNSLVQTLSQPDAFQAEFNQPFSRDNSDESSCDARFSGNDDNEWLARGVPSCICKRKGRPVWDED